MFDKADQKRRMVQYLCGDLSPDERAEFEDSYLKDSEVFQEVVELENEMIDRYAMGELPEPERERFEHSFLSNPARREMVETARSLLAYSAASENAMQPQTPEHTVMPWYRAWGIQFAAAAVLLVMMGGMFWVVSANRRLGNELEKLQREQATAAQDKRMLQGQVDALRAELEQRGTAIQHDIVSFTLGPGVSRGNGELPNLIVPAHVSAVSLHMIVEHDPHSHHSIFLRTADGRLIWRENAVQGRSIGGQNKELTVTLPSRLLQTGDYVVRVSTGNEDPLHTLAGYSFHVVRR
jgi:hypothetical protein